MPQDHDDLSPAASASASAAADFDAAFSAAAASPGIRRVWEFAEPDLPPQVEPFSFVSAGLLRHVAQALDLSPGQRWLHRHRDAGRARMARPVDPRLPGRPRPRRPRRRRAARRPARRSPAPAAHRRSGPPCRHHRNRSRPADRTKTTLTNLHRKGADKPTGHTSASSSFGAIDTDGSAGKSCLEQVPLVTRPDMLCAAADG